MTLIFSVKFLSDYFSKIETYRNEKGELCNPGFEKDRPTESAMTTYFLDGLIVYQDWFLDVIRHNPDGPVVVCFNPDKTICSKYWFHNGRLLTKKEFI